jgi:hypothetical protein
MDGTLRDVDLGPALAELKQDVPPQPPEPRGMSTDMIKKLDPLTAVDWRPSGVPKHQCASVLVNQVIPGGQVLADHQCSRRRGEPAVKAPPGTPHKHWCGCGWTWNDVGLVDA